MNHLPFEDWLHEGRSLNAQQARELQAHLRECRECAALAEVQQALRAVRPVRPPAGFADRVALRLRARRREQRLRLVMGMLLLALGGLGLLAWLAGPTAIVIVRSPATILTSWLSYLIFLLTSLQALLQAGPLLVRVLPDVLPPFTWAVVLSALSGFALLWAVSIWKFTSARQGG